MFPIVILMYISETNRRLGMLVIWPVCNLQWSACTFRLSPTLCCLLDPSTTHSCSTVNKENSKITVKYNTSKVLWNTPLKTYGLFTYTYTETDMGLDFYPEGFPPDLSMAKIVQQRNIHTACRARVLIFGTGPRPQTGIRVLLRVCEWAIRIRLHWKATT